MESLANSAEDGQGMDKESNVERSTFVHGFSQYQPRFGEPMGGMNQDPDDYSIAQPKVFNPTIIQGSSNPGGIGAGMLAGSADRSSQNALMS